MLPTLAVLLTLPALAPTTPFHPRSGIGDDDKKKELTIEEEILKTLRENGVITETQFNDLNKLADKLRKERTTTRAELDAEIRRLSEALDERVAQAASQPSMKPAPDSVIVSYKDGFRMRTADGKFELHPWFVFRERFTSLNPDSKGTGLNQEDTNSFEVRTMRLWFDGHIGSEDLKYLIMFDVASSSTGSTNGILRDAYLDYRFMPEVHVRAGQMKRPVDREGYTYAPRTGFVDKAPVVGFFQRAPASDFEPGVMAWGELEKGEFEWYVGLFNGDGANNGASATNIGAAGGSLLPLNSNNNDSSGLEVTMRANWNALGGPFGYVEGDYEKSPDAHLAFGGFYDYNPERNPFPPAGVGKANISTWGVDGAFRQDGFYALAEYFWRYTNRQPSNAPAPNTDDTGYFVQAEYFLGADPKTGFEVLGRYSVLELDNTGVAIAADTRDEDVSLGLNYLFNGHRLKLQGAYTYRTQNRRARTDMYDQIFQVQLQAIF